MSEKRNSLQHLESIEGTRTFPNALTPADDQHHSSNKPTLLPGITRIDSIKEDSLSQTGAEISGQDQDMKDTIDQDGSSSSKPTPVLPDQAPTKMDSIEEEILLTQIDQCTVQPDEIEDLKKEENILPQVSPPTTNAPPLTNSSPSTSVPLANPPPSASVASPTAHGYSSPQGTGYSMPLPSPQQQAVPQSPPPQQIFFTSHPVPLQQSYFRQGGIPYQPPLVQPRIRGTRRKDMPCLLHCFYDLGCVNPRTTSSNEEILEPSVHIQLAHPQQVASPTPSMPANYALATSPLAQTAQLPNSVDNRVVTNPLYEEPASRHPMQPPPVVTPQQPSMLGPWPPPMVTPQPPPMITPQPPPVVTLQPPPMITPQPPPVVTPQPPLMITPQPPPVVTPQPPPMITPQPRPPVVTPSPGVVNSLPESSNLATKESTKPAVTASSAPSAEDTDAVPYTVIDMDDDSSGSSSSEEEVLEEVDADTEKLVVTHIDSVRGDKNKEVDVVTVHPQGKAPGEENKEKHVKSKKKLTTATVVITEPTPPSQAPPTQTPPTQPPHSDGILAKAKGFFKRKDVITTDEFTDKPQAVLLIPSAEDVTEEKIEKKAPQNKDDHVTVVIIQQNEASTGEEKVQFTPKEKILRDELLVDIFCGETGRAIIQNVQTEESYKETCCECCCEQCCDVNYTCSTVNCSLRNINIPMKKKEGLSKTLRMGMVRGLQQLGKMVFKDLVEEGIRKAWVTLEFLTICIGFFLTVATVSIADNTVFTIAHLILIILSFILASLDFFHTYRDWFHELTKKEKPKSDDNEQTCGQKCCSCCKGSYDILRIILSELIIYPLLICDLFEFITNKGFEGTSHVDRLGFALFILSCISLVLYVYVARTVVLIYKVSNIKEFREKVEKKEDYKMETEEMQKSALRYQIGFVVHVIGQMISQILIFIAIAGKIRYDNRHFYEEGNTDTTIYVSSNLAYMIVAGGITPILGYFSFFIVTSSWAQEVPMGVFLDMLRYAKMTANNQDDLIDVIRLKKDDNDILFGKGSEHMLKNFLNKFREEFRSKRETNCFTKFSYPFSSPPLVIICMVYTVLQFAFILCAAFTMGESGTTVQILNGGGWIIYYFFAVIVGAVANIYVFIVTGFWVTVIIIVLAVIAIIIATILALIGLCLFIMCLGGSSNNNNNQRKY